MAIPGSVLNGLNIDPGAPGLNFYPSLATFYRVVKTDASDGQELHSFVTVDIGHTNVPCRRSPQILIRPQLQEHDTSEFDMGVARFQVNLDRPMSIDITWQVVIDGVLYEIQSVEGDGNNLLTRFMATILRPFNA